MRTASPALALWVGVLSVLSLAASAFIAPQSPLSSGRAPSDVLSNQRSLSRLFGELDEGAGFASMDGSKVRVGIIKARWNSKITDNLLEGVMEALAECGVRKENTFQTEVPGAYELPLAARFLALSNTVDCIVCLGCLIKGETYHFEYIAESVSSGLMQVGLSTSCPVVFGVLTTADEQQAISRSSGKNNHGVSWGMTAVEMGLLRMSALGQGKGGVSLGFGEMKKIDVGESASKPEKVGF